MNAIKRKRNSEQNRSVPFACPGRKNDMPLNMFTLSPIMKSAGEQEGPGGKGRELSECGESTALTVRVRAARQVAPSASLMKLFSDGELLVLLATKVQMVISPISDQDGLNMRKKMMKMMKQANTPIIPQSQGVTGEPTRNDESL